MKKRVLSLLMALTLCLSLLPTAALAEMAGAGADAVPVEQPAPEDPEQVDAPEQVQEPEQEQPENPVQTGEPEQNGDPAQTQTPAAPEGEPDTTDTPTAPVENGDENGNGNGNENENEIDPVQAAQALIDALPDEVTADNADELEAQLMALDAALAALTEEQLGQLDMTRFEVLCEAMNNLTAEQENGTHTDHALCTHGDGCTICPTEAKNNAFTDAKALTAKDGKLYIGSQEEQLSSTSSCYELSDGSYYLEGDIELSCTIRIPKDAKVNLCLNGHSITKNADDKNDYDGVIMIEDGVTLSLCDCKGGGTITHGTKSDDTKYIGRGVKVGRNNIATFHMFGGEISGNHAGSTDHNQDGGGVYVYGTFNMYGGKITDNHVDKVSNYGGGGVCMSGGTFIMYDGEISGNTSKRGGGISSNGTVTINGGTISGNTATSGDGGGVYYRCTSSDKSLTVSDTAKIEQNTAGGNGGGVYCSISSDSSSMTVSGSAQIVKNNAVNGGGIYVEQGTVKMEGGTIGSTESDKGNTANYGGGVYVGKSDSNGTFNMSGGEISGNKATGNSGMGGGVNVKGTFSMSQNAKITGNSATWGGGVHITSGGAVTMSGGSITGNTAGKGGGVCVDLGSSFTMTGGTIGGSTAADANTAGDGGGVCVTGGTFNMNGGKVAGNTATSNGGGVDVYEGAFNMSDSAVITGNSAELYGGGVKATGSANGPYAFNMKGGSITGNNVTGTSNDSADHFGHGGGVYVDKTVVMTISGGVQIHDNWEKGTKNANGVYVKGENGSANNLYLYSENNDAGKGIVSIGQNGLEASARIDVTTRRVPATGSPIKIATSAIEERDYTKIFTPDVSDKGYTIKKTGTDLFLSTHEHDWTYTASGATITASCACGKSLDYTIAKPSGDLTYSGTAKEAMVNYEAPTWTGFPVKPTPTYQVKNGESFEAFNDVPTNAGTYRASITMGGVTASVEYTIQQAEPKAENFEFTAPDSLTYDGNPKTATVEAKSGIVGMGAVAVKYYDTAGQEVTPINAGTYTVKISVAEGTNYNAASGLTADGWAFTISRAKLTLNADDFTFKATDELIYDGNPKTAEVTWKTAAKAKGFGKITVKYYDKDGKQLEGAPTNAGTYTVKINVAEGVGCEAQNDISSNSWAFTIKPAEQALSYAKAEVSKTYGEGTFTNPLSADGIQGTIAYTSSNTDVATVDKNGQVTILAASTEPVTITASTEGTNNYSSATASYTLTVAKKAITVSGITANDKTYDGKTSATLDYTGATITDKVDSDELTVTATGTFENKDVGEKKQVNITDLTLGGEAADNYQLATSGQQTTASASISPAVIYLGNVVIAEKIYDGTANATITEVTFTGLLASDSLTEGKDYTVSSSPYKDTKTDKESAEAGVGTKMLSVTVTLTDSVKNYRFSGSNEKRCTEISYGLTIKQATPEITAEDTRTITKNGVEVDISNWASFNNTDGGAKLTYALVGTPAGITLENNKLKAEDNASTVTTFSIKVNAVATTNFTAPVEKTITVTVANKPAPELDGALTINPTEITYGQALSEITITGTMKDPTTHVEVKGTFTWQASDTVLTAGTHDDVAWKFTPTDTTTYAETTGTVTVKVNQAETTGEPGYTKITTSGKTLKDAGLTIGTLNPSEGTLEWIGEDGKKLDDTTVVEANKSYTWRFTPTDTANYTTLTGEIELYHKSSGYYYYPTDTGTDTKTSAGTGDAGLLPYAVTALMSYTGTAALLRRRKRED